jgi:hypothetical protein
VVVSLSTVKVGYTLVTPMESRPTRIVEKQVVMAGASAEPHSG